MLRFQVIDPCVVGFAGTAGECSRGRETVRRRALQCAHQGAR